MLLREIPAAVERLPPLPRGDRCALCSGTLFSSFRTKSPLIKRIRHIITRKLIVGEV